MEFKGSKSPWNYDGNVHGAVEGSIDNLVASVYPMHYENAEEMKANAYLIAAAPELLEALIEMQRNGRKQGWNDIYESSMEKTRLAIAKALGQQ
ncbi:hypothetical protein MWH14_07105 [Providencia stuartii]|uniref:hypothetical protein n=1 Tax=Providencia stuartii TaxID=588 RepID=UPI002020A305|nr:hypothetical protein [Providencia stuartii]ELR5046381.1 hypothetical protein [Providencia rettgeri]URE76852.1 hypothetical protein MWH14_00080 [Providencia stuartii]URE80063.1 hypothetical protein MWH14_07105 [Providencia stuartii]